MSTVRIAPVMTATMMVAILGLISAPNSASAVSSAPRTSQTRSPVPLESFGPPTEGYLTKGMANGCYKYRVATRRAPIVMGGTQYAQGFELATPGICLATNWTWTWHIAGHYSGFSACVGLAGGDTSPATLSFLGPTGGALKFGADGTLVHSTTLVAGLPTFVTLGTERLMNLVIRTTTSKATIGFGDDGLYLGGVPVKEC